MCSWYSEVFVKWFFVGVWSSFKGFVQGIYQGRLGAGSAEQETAAVDIINDGEWVP